MGTFFDMKTPADRKLLQDYDAAVVTFRDEVSKAMDDAAAKEPSIAPLMKVAAEALRARPLPSEVNASDDALKRLTLSSMTVELAFSKLQSHADSDQAMAAAMGVVTKMREIGKTTTGAPEFRHLTHAVLQAVGEMKPEVQKEMDASVLEAYLAELKKASAPASGKKNNFQP
jgi:hypothetical protein